MLQNNNNRIHTANRENVETHIAFKQCKHGMLNERNRKRVGKEKVE